MPHAAAALHPHAGHEVLRGGDVREELGEAADIAVAIVKANVRGGDPAESLLADGRVGFGP